MKTKTPHPIGVEVVAVPMSEYGTSSATPSPIITISALPPPRSTNTIRQQAIHLILLLSHSPYLDFPHSAPQLLVLFIPFVSQNLKWAHNTTWGL